jgi:hypothetical protein
MRRSGVFITSSALGRLLAVIACGLAAFLAACVATGGADAGGFESPEAAVPVLRDLVRLEDWPGLAAHYDLSGSGVERRELTSGAFFLAPGAGELGQPREVVRYRHPFAPAYELRRVIATQDPEVVVMEMGVEIDQGEGMPPQRGLSWFKMRRSPNGWKVLPERVEGPGA